MNNKVKLLLAVVVAVALFAGVYVLYNNLSARMGGPGLVVQQPVQEEAKEETQEKAQEEVTEATEETEEELNERPMAPDFTVTDQAGNQVKLTDYQGKPVVLNFWASWCGPCKMEMPDFETAYQEYGQDIHFLMVNLTDGSRETMETASAFVEGQGYSFPLLFDDQQEAAIAYGVRSIPTTYFIDAQGHAVAVYAGALNMPTLEKGIEMIQ